MQAYYSLYIDATDELRHMESYITAEHKRGRRMLEVRLRFPLRLASASARWAGLRAPSLLVSAASLTFTRRAVGYCFLVVGTIAALRACTACGQCASASLPAAHRGLGVHRLQRR